MTKFNSLWVIASLSVLTFLSACTDSQETQSAAPPQMPPPAVDVAVVDRQEVSNWKEYTGRLEASKSIVVRPRSSGYIVDVGFRDGARVEKGDLLFQVDYRTIRADVERLEAELVRAEAQIELATRDLKRAESLRTTNAISQEQFDNRRTELTQATANANSVRAELKKTRVQNEITAVRAEFDGQVSNARVKVGSSVVAGDTTLTTLVATDSMHAYFDVDEPTYLKLLAQGFDYINNEIHVDLGLAGQDGFPFQGRVDFVDNQVNTATGTIRMRAVYDNAKGELKPGLFARVRMQIGTPFEALMIPEKAIGTDLSSKYVLVVDDNNMVGYRPVQLGQRRGDLRIVNAGLQKGERIIVSGLLRVRPGMPVSPTTMGASGEEAE